MADWKKEAKKSLERIGYYDYVRAKNDAYAEQMKKEKEEAEVNSASQLTPEERRARNVRSRYAERRAKQTNPTLRRYNIDPDTFDEDDLHKWALSHNFDYYPLSDGPSMYYPKFTGGFLGTNIGAKRLTTKQEEEDLIVLENIVKEKRVRKMAEKAPITTSVASVTLAPVRGMIGAFEVADSIYESITGGEGAPDYMSLNEGVNYARNEVDEKYASKWFNGKTGKIGNYGSLLYNGLMAIGDNAVNAYVGRGMAASILGESASLKGIAKVASSITSGLMASDATASAIARNKKRGLSDRKATALGVSTGLAEYVTEKYSLDKILKAPKNVFKGAIRDFVAEGSEEVSSNIINYIADVIIGQDDSEILQKYNGFKRAGLSEKEAILKTAEDCFYDTLSAGIVGGFSGVTMGGTYHSAGTIAQRNNVGSQIKKGNGTLNAIVDVAMDYDKNSKIYKTAEGIKSAVADGKSVSDYSVGKLYSDIETDIRNQYKSDTDSVIKNYDFIPTHYDSKSDEHVRVDSIEDGFYVVRNRAGDTVEVNATDLKKNYETLTDNEISDYVINRTVDNELQNRIATKTGLNSLNNVAATRLAKAAGMDTPTAKMTELVSKAVRDTAVSETGLVDVDAVRTYAQAYVEGLKSNMKSVYSEIDSRTDNVAEAIVEATLGLDGGHITETLKNHALFDRTVNNFKKAFSQILSSNYAFRNEFGYGGEADMSYRQLSAINEGDYSSVVSGVDALASRAVTDSAVAYDDDIATVRSILDSGEITSAQADRIISTPALRDAFTRLTGRKIEGTKAEQRAIVQNYRTETLAAEQETVPEDIAEIEVAIEETLKNGAEVAIFKAMENEGKQGDLTLFAERLREKYAKTGSIGALSNFFTDGGRRVIAVMEGDNVNAKTQDIKRRAKTIKNSFTEYAEDNARIKELEGKIKDVSERIESLPDEDMRKINGRAAIREYEEEIEDIRAVREIEKEIKASGREKKSDVRNAEYEHLYDEEKVSKAYIDSVNTEIENAIISIRNGNTDSVPEVIKVTELDEKTIKAVSDFVGYDVSGYVCKIERDRLVHIENRHGINGDHDQSLSDPKDTARMGYVINNSDRITWVVDSKGNRVYDSKYNDRHNKIAPVFVMEKRIDGTYSISQAVPDSKKKTLWITSARIEKAAVGSQVPNADNSPQLTPETPLVSSSASDNIVSQNNDIVNSSVRTDTENDTQNDVSDVSSGENLVEYTDYGYELSGLPDGNMLSEIANDATNGAVITLKGQDSLSEAILVYEDDVTAEAVKADIIQYYRDGVMPDAAYESDLPWDDVKFSVENIRSKRYSVSETEDDAYMDAYYDGDEEKAQELVDKVAKRFGYTYKAYHRTENGFTVFDLSKARKSMDIQGFFFSADAEAEREYGSVRYDTFLKMNNPYIVDSNEKQKAIPFDLSKMDSGVTAREWLQENGYDSVIRKAEYFGAEADEYIVFDSSQIKSAEPFTYADDEYGEGDIIPLSERFNEDSKDIRYSFSSIGASFFGDENISAEEFEMMVEDGSYKKKQGYRDYVQSCVDVYRQSRGINDTLSDGEVEKIEQQIEGIMKVAIAAKKAGYDIYDDGKARSVKDSQNRLLFSSLEPNSDYITSSDISTICDKRTNFSEIYDEIVRLEEERGVPANKRFFSNVDNYFIIHKIMADKGLTIPCEECYVESMRKNLGRMAKSFIELVSESDENNKANEQLYHQKGKNKGKLKTANATRRNNVREILSESDIFSIDDITVEMLTTAKGLAKLRLQAPLVYEQFNAFYGQAKPKLTREATPFRPGELIALLTKDDGTIDAKLVEEIAATGGFRLQSYSDFQIKNYVDVLRTIFEAGMLGLNGHAYTKVPAFLEATDGTNLKRNISIFMYEDGGEWKLDKKNSFPMELEDIYSLVASDDSGNTSIIAVSQNADMSAWIMANDNVGYGIPFHKSGLKMDVVRGRVVKTPDRREVLGYANEIDHTKQQSEVYKKTLGAKEKANTKVKKPVNIYSFWDFENKGNLSKNELIEKNVKRYIDECEKRNYRPKFRAYVMNNGKLLNKILEYSKELGFVSQDATIDDISFKHGEYTIPYGYYKFLGDFGMFKAGGTASPIETLSLEKYDFDNAVAYFDNAKNLRTTELLQQLENGEVREQYRKMIDDGELTTEQLEGIIKEKRSEVVDDVIGRNEVKHSTESEVNENEQGRNGILSGDVEGRLGESAGEQSGRILERSGASEENGRRGQGDSRSRRIYGETVRKNGGTEVKRRGFLQCEFVKEEYYNDDMKRVAAENSKKGITTHFFVGDGKHILKKGLSFRGAVRGNEIFIQCDNAKYSAEQINKHEVVHREYKSEAIQKIKAYIESKLTKEEKKNISERLYANYRSVTKGDVDAIFEEFVCDVMAGMNDYGVRFGDIVNEYWSNQESDVDIYSPAEYTESIDAGGEVNGGKYSEELVNQGVSKNNDSIWERSDDSEGLYTSMGDGKGNLQAVEEKREGPVDWHRKLRTFNVHESREKEHAYGLLRKISGLKIADVDANGNTLSPQVKAYFEKSVLKNSKGELIPFYHATDGDFNVFEKGDFGFHIGNVNQAIDLNKKYIKEVYANITKPMYIQEDPMRWYGLVIASKALSQKIISFEEYNNLAKLDGFDSYDYNSEANKAIRELLKQKGYNGIIYNNGFEGEGISALVFDSNQLKYTSNENPTVDDNLKFSFTEDENTDYLAESIGKIKNDINEVRLRAEMRKGKVYTRDDVRQVAASIINNIDVGTGEGISMSTGDKAALLVLTNRVLNSTDASRGNHIKRMAAFIAQKAKVFDSLDSYDYASDLKELKANIVHSIALTNADKATLDSIGASGYKSVFGGGKVGVDVVYAELSSQRPDMFPMDTNATDTKLIRIVEMYDFLKNGVGDTSERLIDILNNDDKKAFIGLVEKEIDSAFGNEKIGKDSKIVSEVNKVKERLKKTYEKKLFAKRETTAIKTSIRNIVSNMRKNLQKNEKTGGYPKEIVKVAAEVLSAIDMHTNRTAPDGMPTKASLKLDALKMEYDALKNNKVFDFQSEYSEELSEKIGALHNLLKDRQVIGLDVYELSELKDILSEISHRLSIARKQIGLEKKKENAEIASEIINDIKRNNVSNNTHKKQWLRELKSAGQDVRAFVLNPHRVNEVIAGYDKNSEWWKLYDAINRGSRKAAKFVMDANKPFDALIDGDKNEIAFYDYRTKTFKTGIKYTDGSEVEIPKSIMCELVMAWKRDAGRKHLEVGGATIPDVKLYNKGMTSKAIDEFGKVTMPITQKDIDRLNDMLDEYDKKWIDKAHYLFDNTTKDAINETSMQLLGRELAKVKNYIRLYVDTDFVNREIADGEYSPTLEGHGSLKETVKNAAQPILLRGLHENVYDQIDFVSKYYGLAIPIRNFNKVYASRLGIGDNAVSVRKTIGNAFGPQIRKNVVEQLILDLQTSRKSKGDIISQGYEKIRGAWLTATFWGNIRSTLKQTTSYWTASAILGEDSLAAGLARYVKSPKKTKAEIEKYSGTLYKRSQGLSTTELGDRANAKRLAGASKSLTKFINKYAPVLRKIPQGIRPGNWLQSMDVSVSSALWEACKVEVAKTIKNADGRYMSAVADLYERVIEETQSNYDVIHRPEALKTTNPITRTVTMFQTDNLQQTGIIYGALGDYKAKSELYKNQKSDLNKKALNEAKTRLSKAVRSRIYSSVWLVFATTLGNMLLRKFKPYIDDEEKEITSKSVLEQAMLQTSEDMLGVLFPVVGDLTTKFMDTFSNGYDFVSDPSFDAIQELIEATSKIWKSVAEGEDVKDALVDAIPSISNFTGIPLKNIYDLYKSVNGYAGDIAEGEFVHDITDYGSSKSFYTYADLASCIIDGDKEKETKILDYYSENGREVSKSSLTKAIKPIYLDLHKTSPQKAEDIKSKLIKDYGYSSKTIDNWTTTKKEEKKD